MGESRCECCDILVQFCTKKKQDAARLAEIHRRQKLLTIIGGWFEAQYPGICCSCGEEFEPGTAIRSQNGSWLAECCSVEVL